jgi:LysM domain/Transglycosylase SLT domain
MITVVAHSAPAARQVSTSVPVNSAYVVKPGDNLWSIAEQFYGTNLGPSSAGAMGRWQFMPGTWPSYSSAPFSQATSWSASTPAYIKLTNQLLKWSGGNVQQALAAYNAGQGYANTILAKAG